MSRSDIVFAEVSALYEASTTTMGRWMWRNHTQWVAGKAKALAKKYGTNAEQAYCAGLLHDLGDSKYERGHADFDTWSWETSKQILKKAGFRHTERKAIMEAIRTHSCHPGNLPTAPEGKVLASADGMWHIQTNFFAVICYLNRPPDTHTYEEWTAWFKAKIDRDYGVKIFFDDEKTELKEDYEALLRVFGNTPLDSGDEQ